MYSNNLAVNQNNTKLIDNTRPADCIVTHRDPEFLESGPLAREYLEVRNDGFTYTLRFDRSFLDEGEVVDERWLTDEEFELIKVTYEENVKQYGRVWEK